jgi:hypothetical protein
VRFTVDAPTSLGDLLVARPGAAHRMFVRAGTAKDQMRVAVDQSRSHPGAAERVHLLRSKAGQFGALADADDLAVRDPDGAILDDAQRIAGPLLKGRDVAVDEQPVPHDLPLGEHDCYGKA